METGGSSSASKPKENGFFSSLFGGDSKKKKQPVKENRPLEGEMHSEEPLHSYVPKHVSDPGLTIHDGVMETGIVDCKIDSYPHPHQYAEEKTHQVRYEEPRHPGTAHRVHEEEENLFEEEEISTRPVKKTVPQRSADIVFAVIGGASAFLLGIPLCLQELIGLY